MLFPVSCLLTWSLGNAAAVYGRLQRNVVVPPMPDPRYFAEPIPPMPLPRRGPYYVMGPAGLGAEQLPPIEDNAYEYDVMPQQSFSNYEWIEPRVAPLGVAVQSSQQEADDAEDAEQLWSDLMANYVSKKSSPPSKQTIHDQIPATSTEATSRKEASAPGSSQQTTTPKTDDVQKKSSSYSSNGQKEFAMPRPAMSASSFQDQGQLRSTGHRRTTTKYPRRSSLRRLGQILEDNLTEELGQLRAQ